MPRRRARAARLVLWSLAAGHAAMLVKLRQRRASLAALRGPEPNPGLGLGAATGAAAAITGDDVVVLSAPGVVVDAATRAAVAQEMTDLGLEMIDLLPGDLPAEEILAMLGRVDLERLATDPLYTPGGAHQAMALHPALARRMEIEGSATVERIELTQRSIQAQVYASCRTTVRLAPGVRAVPETGEDRWRQIEQAMAYLRPHFEGGPALLGLETANLVAVTAGALIAPLPALVALAAWSAQPAGALGPDNLAASLLRAPRAWALNLRTVAACVRALRAMAAERDSTPAPVAPPQDELFEPRRDTCPWCGSAALTGRLDSVDLLQHKPGNFHLDECTACGHVFQNPALSIAGLDFYYESFYDGDSEAMAESSFAMMDASYRGRVEAVARVTEPQSWLDVGTGHGHFCLIARQRWPQARFDGLDMSESIDEAVRRGWIDNGYRGLFPDMADGLPHSYDVVSMHHYLEHTREPRREIAAAAKVLEPGGYLMIEVPDPESPWARRFGRYWGCYFQPQHQHMVPCHNMVAELEETGFDVVSVERGPATTGFDVSFGLLLWTADMAPSPYDPWRPERSPLQRVKRAALLAAMMPTLVGTLVADTVKDTWHRRPGNPATSNAYRIVARRR